MFPEHTHANMLKGEMSQRVGQLKQLQHVSCTFASLQHSEHGCILPPRVLKQNLPEAARRAESLARPPALSLARPLDGWIHKKDCLTYVHILGCFLVWFPRLSRAKKRSWDNRNFLSLVGLVTRLFHKLHVSPPEQAAEMCF